MRPFRYETAGDPAEAVGKLAASPGAKYLGGGTNLADLMRLGVETPDVLVDVRRLASDRIEELPDGGLRIGAGVRNSDLAAHRLVRERYPMLAQAILMGASGQVRNLATVAGNLLQRTRCLYFQDATKPCNKRTPGSGCPAIEGEHRGLAILGHSAACVATHPSDMAVPLVALDAVVHVLGRSGERTLPLRGVFRLPGDRPERETMLDREELITAVELPPCPFATRSRYRKVRDRASFAFALVSIAVALDVGGGIVHAARVALGGVAPVPWRAVAAEAELRGRPATEETFLRAALAELREARPLPHNGFKVTLARNLLVRTLADLAEPDWS